MDSLFTRFFSLRSAFTSLVAMMCALSVAMLIMRLPFSFYLLAVSSLGALVLVKKRYDKFDLIFGFVFLVFLGQRLLSIYLNDGQLTDIIGLLVLVLFYFGFVNFDDLSRRKIFFGFLGGTLGVLAFGLYELSSGVSLSRLIYSDSDIQPLVLSSRWHVSGFFPNYNDYSVVMYFLSVFLVFLIIRYRSKLVLLCSMLLAFFLVAGHAGYMGSRGYILALAFSLICIVLSYSYSLPRTLFTSLALLLFGLGAIIFFNQVAGYFFDNSTNIRLSTLSGFVEIVRADYALVMFGFPSFAHYLEAMSAACVGCSVSPHNLVLELVAMHGLTVGFLYLVLWLYCLSTLIIMRTGYFVDWYHRYFFVLFLASPIWGLVSSSSLNFYFIYFISVFVLAYVAKDISGRTSQSQFPNRVTTSVFVDRER